MNSRRYDLDWLRIIAFGLLIFYHVGMFYVPWYWHVKSVHAGPAIEPLMGLLNPWRLPLLFFISGVALRFAFDKHLDGKLLRFTGGRVKRLLTPVVFGMLVIVPPQSWLELLEKREISLGFWQFYPIYAAGNFSDYSVIIPTWNHLWYVVYLLAYTVILAPIAEPIARLMTGGGKRVTARLFHGHMGVAMVLILPVIPHIIYRFTLDPIFPQTNALWGDWAHHAHNLTTLIVGYVLAKDEYFWNAVKRATAPAAVLVLILIGSRLAVPGFDDLGMRRLFYSGTMVILLLGLAMRWLNRDGPVLRYMTEAIFPWYILHQTLVVCAGYWLTRQGLSVGVEFALVLTATFGGCALIHEVLVRRFKYIRPLFGLKALAPLSPALLRAQGHEAKR